MVRERDRRVMQDEATVDDRKKGTRRLDSSNENNGNSLKQEEKVQRWNTKKYIIVNKINDIVYIFFLAILHLQRGW